METVSKTSDGRSDLGCGVKSMYFFERCQQVVFSFIFRYLFDAPGVGVNGADDCLASDASDPVARASEVAVDSALVMTFWSGAHGHSPEVVRLQSMHEDPCQEPRRAETRSSVTALLQHVVLETAWNPVGAVHDIGNNEQEAAPWSSSSTCRTLQTRNGGNSQRTVKSQLRKVSVAVCEAP